MSILKHHNIAAVYIKDKLCSGICANKIAKRILIGVLAIIIAFISVTECFAADSNADVGYSLAVNNKLQTNKSFNAEITLSGRENVAAMIFTVCFDSSVMEFKSAQISDGADGKLEANCVGDQVKLVFLNTKGQELNADGTGIITLKFKALSNPCTAFMTIYGEQAVSAQEVRLSCEYGVEYSVELMEKISGEVSLANGSSLKNTSSSGASSKSSNSKSSSSKASNQSGNIKQNGSTSYQSQMNDSFGSQSSGESNNAKFIFGFIAALCVVCAVAGIFVLGKKRGETQLAQKLKNNETGKADLISENNSETLNEVNGEESDD